MQSSQAIQVLRRGTALLPISFVQIGFSSMEIDKGVLEGMEHGTGITLLVSTAISATWSSRCSARSILQVKASEKRHLIHLESLSTSLVSSRQLALMICCSNVNDKKNKMAGADLIHLQNCNDN